MENNFKNRLEWLLNGRKIHRWGTRIGLTKTVITRMNQGVLPGADRLKPIVKAENASLTWLICGRGEKYLLVHGYSDQNCADIIREIYERSYGGPWKTHVLIDGFHMALVLTRPGSYEIDEVTYLHTVVEVVVGPMGDKVLAVIAEQNNDSNTFIAETSVADMQALYRGDIGTYGLLHTADALLNKARPLRQKESQRFASSHQVAEATPGYQVEQKVSAEEMVLIEDLRRLDDESIGSVEAVIRSLVGRQDK